MRGCRDKGGTGANKTLHLWFDSGTAGKRQLLSRRMLDLTKRQRALQLPRLLGEIVGKATGELVLLDNIEILFDVHLKQHPLPLLKGLSRNQTVVAPWNGSIVDGHMTYAVPDHPEYRRYPMRDLLVARPEVTT